jgi:predicted XRE-type DNA-binding protein
VIARIADTPLEINEVAWNAMDTAFRAGSSKVLSRHVLDGLTVYELLERTKLSQSAIAKRTGISASSLSQLKNGTYKGDVPGMEKKLGAFLADALAQPTGDFKADEFELGPGGSTAAEKRESICRRKAG